MGNDLSRSEDRVMVATTATRQRSKLIDLVIWGSIFIGPIAWGLDLQVSYSLTYWACSNGRPSILRIIGAAALLLAVAGIALASWALKQLPRNSEDSGGHSRDRAHFLAVFGLVTSISFAIVIVAESVPRYILSPCE